MKHAAIFALFFVLTSCYRMPTENDFSVVPTTNNRSLTQERNESLMPSVGY